MKSAVKFTGKSLQLVRIFSAPRPVVFSYWSQAEKMERWSGCKEATNCKIEMDFRPGGSFIQQMHISGAGDFSVVGKYDEIVEPEKIVYRLQLGSANVRVVVEFLEQGLETKVVMTHDGLPDNFHAKTVSQGTSEGLDKLEKLLSNGRAT